MGDVSLILNVEVQQEAKSTLSEIDEGLGVLSNIAGVIGGPAAVIGLLALFIKKTDPVEQALQGIRDLIDAALHFEVVHDAEEHQFHIKDVLSPAETSWGTLTEVGLEKALGSPGSLPNPLVDFAIVQQNTFNAVSALKDPIYWKRPYYDELDYRDDWFGHIDPRPTADLGPNLREVFDYRLTMPSFLHAIEIRCAVMLAFRSLRPDIVTGEIFANSLIIEFLPATNVVAEKYEKIVNGFVMARVPASSGEDHKAWERAGMRIGVVDTYAGLGNAEQAFKVPGFFSEIDFVVFQPSFRLGNLIRWQSLYLATGLHAVWGAIQHLRVLSGQPESAELVDKRAFLSLTEIDTALGTIFQDLPPAQGSPIRASDTLRRLYKVGKLTFPDPLVFGDRLTLRKGLLAAAY